MHGIGEFAQIAKVSVRTLRHYDQIGLLRPAHVDESSGYRSYASAQLTELHRILALKDAGLTLSEIRSTQQQSNEVVVEVLRGRLDDLERTIEEERERAARVRARLQLMTGNHPMFNDTESNQPETNYDTAVVVKPLDGHYVAAASKTAPDFEADFAPIFAELYPTIYGELGRLGIVPGGPTIAFYEVLEGGEVLISAGVPIPPGTTIESDDVQVRELEPAERGATLVHKGSMATVDQSFIALDQWMTDAGESPAGYSREIYLNCPVDSVDQADWVTELQFELA